MDEQVAHRHLARDVRVGHREPGQVAHDRRVPLELPFLDELRQQRRGERLGERRDAEARAGGDRLALAELLHPVPLRDHDAAVLHDGEADTRHVELAHRARDVRIEISGKRRRRLRGGGRRDRQRGGEGEDGATDHVCSGTMGSFTPATALYHASLKKR
jgi:hypothetical protein